MINFIICVNDNEVRRQLVLTTKNFLYKTLDCYKIHEFETYNHTVQGEIDHIKGIKIYLLDLDNPSCDVLSMAKNARSNGDFDSQIILLTRRQKGEVFDDLNNILYLDLLTMDECFEKELIKSIMSAHGIVTRHSAYGFSSYDEVYRIPYDDIYMINKRQNSDTVDIITRDDSYVQNASLKTVYEGLKSDPRFLLVHRSSIINVHKVTLYDIKSNTVYFDNGLDSNLVSRDKKPSLIMALKNLDKRIAETEDVKKCDATIR